jgi:hypothetical protein
VGLTFLTYYLVSYRNRKEFILINTHNTLRDFPLLAVIASCLLIMAFVINCSDSDDDGEDNNGGSAVGGTGGKSGDTTGDDGGTTADSGTKEDAGRDGPATDEQKRAVCQCFVDIGTVPNEALIDTCAENITDVCITCVERIMSGTACTESNATDFDDCLIGCLGFITAPADAAECKRLVAMETRITTSPDRTDCLCDNCLDVFGSCIVNPYCSDILICAEEVGCSDIIECLDPCRDPITAAYNANSEFAMLANSVGVCDLENNCSGAESTPDGGVADSGE